MAQMLPPAIFDDTGKKVPRAEVEVFNWLSSTAPASWVVFHSVWLKDHEYKKSGEADFVVVTDTGILVLEVKGGKVFRDKDGRWIYRKKGKSDRVENESPIRQASTAYFAIQEYLYEADCRELIERVAWGWGAVLAHCVWQVPESDPEIEGPMLLDQKHFPEDTVPWLEQLVEYWREDYGKKNRRKLARGNSLQTKISPETKNRVVDLLRPRFENIVGLGQRTREAEQNFIRLTDRQCLHLLSARANPRVLIEGPAGTGKTLLCFKFARECAENGEKVLFVCFNVNLAKRLQQQAASEPSMASVEINNYHRLIIELRKKAGLETSLSGGWEEFNSSCGELVIEAIDILGDDALYDRIIMDEGQDLMSNEFLDVLDLLLRAGMFPNKSAGAAGNWMVAMDSAQALYEKHFQPAALDRLKTVPHSSLPLSENCRNTRPIAAHVYGFSDSGSCDVMSADGPDPIFDYYENQKELIELIREYVNEAISEFERVEMDSSEIVILTGKKDLIPAKLFNPGVLDRPLVRYADSAPGDVVWETVHGFKGLEAAMILLIGVDLTDGDYIKQLLYVGGSRARVNLVWLMPDENSEAVQKGLPAVGRLLSRVN